MNRDARGWEKTFAKHSSNEGLCPQHKEFSKFNSKIKQAVQLKNGQKR